MFNLIDALVESYKSNRRFDGWSLADRDPQFLTSLLPLWEWLYRYYFRVKTDGWHHIPASGKMLLVGSHNGGLAAPDMWMFMYDWFRRFGTERLAYGLMHPQAWRGATYLGLTPLVAKMGAVQAHPKMAIAALQKDATVLVYPGGAEDVFRPYQLRHQIYFAGRKGFIKLALRENTPIVPVISEGAHDTLIILTDIYKQVRQLHEAGMPWILGIDPVVFPIYLGLPWGLGIGPAPNIPIPVQIHTRVCAPIIFERYGKDAARDRHYVNACYEQVCNQMQLELNRLVDDVKLMHI